TEATIKSGSLITARLTSEQGKQVFAIPSHIDNSNAEGCHHLIREGATLVYHPRQVLDDISVQLPSQSQQHQLDHNSKAQSLDKSAFNQSATIKKTIKPQEVKPAPSITVPEHLTTLFEKLDWHGQDLDALILVTKLVPAQLIGQLMELELLGAVTVQGGRYLRI
ncbi:DNA-processing protein DprA, partial [Psychrobacter sp. 16-Bac2893]